MLRNMCLLLYFSAIGPFKWVFSCFTVNQKGTVFIMDFRKPVSAVSIYTGNCRKNKNVSLILINIFNMAHTSKPYTLKRCEQNPNFKLNVSHSWRKYNTLEITNKHYMYIIVHVFFSKNFFTWLRHVWQLETKRRELFEISWCKLIPNKCTWVSVYEASVTFYCQKSILYFGWCFFFGGGYFVADPPSCFEYVFLATLCDIFDNFSEITF